MSVHNESHEGVGSEGVQTHHVSLSDESKQSSAYDTNYVLIVLEVMNKVGLQPIEDVMDTEAKLMDVTAQMQSDLTTIQEYLTRIENLSHSGGSWYMGANKWEDMPPGQSGWLGPNANNGLAYNEFHENPNFVGNPSDPDVSKGAPDGSGYYVADDFKTATQGFISAMKDIYMGEDCSEGDPSAASNFVNFSVNKTDADGNTITQNFDLTDTFNGLNANASGWGLLQKFGGSAFSTSSTHGASLIQQFAYNQYKLKAEEHAGPIPGGDISNLGFSVDPTDSSCDGTCKSVYSLLNSFNTAVTTDRENDGSRMYNGQLSNTTNNFLNYIFGDSEGFENRPGSVSRVGEFYVNIYGAFSYAAFNYYWTKNPNASTAQADCTTPQPPKYYPPSGDSQDYGFDKDDKGVVGDGDKLSTWYSTSQSSSSLLSSQANENSTTMQQYTSEVSQYQNIGQNIIKSSSENNIATVQNFKSG